MRTKLFTLLAMAWCLVAGAQNQPPIVLKYFDDYPRVINPPGRFILPLETSDKSRGGVPYNYIVLSDFAAWLNVNGVTNAAQVLATNVVTTNLFATYITNFLEYTTNLFATTITNNTFVSSNAYITNLTVNNITNVTLLTSNVFATNIYTTNLYATNIYATNIFSTSNVFNIGKGGRLTVTNAFFSFITNNFEITTNLTVNFVTNDILYSTNIFTTNLFATTITNVTLVTSNAYITNLTVNNITNNNSYVTNQFVTTNNTFLSFTTNLFSTNIFTTNLFATTITNVTLVTSNEYVTNLTANYITNITEVTSNLYATNIFTTNLYATNIYSTNLFTTNLFATYNFSTNLFSTNIITTNLFATTITNNTFFTSNIFTTNITIIQPGGLTNFNATPNTLAFWDSGDALISAANGLGALTNNGSGGLGYNNHFVPDLNGNLTNASLWGPTFFQELDATTAYLTNTFVFKTNAVLAGDSNGQVANVSIGSGLSFSGNTLSAIGTASTPYASNVVSGGVLGTNTLSATSGLNGWFLGQSNTAPVWESNGGAITNLNGANLQAGTVANAALANSSVTFSGTANQITGGGTVALGASATFAIANPLLAPGPISTSAITNTGNSASSVKGTDANKGEVTISNAHGALTNSASGPASFGLLANTELQNSSITIQGAAVSLGGSTLAAGSAPFFDLNASTNLVYPTNAIPANAILTSSQSYTTNLTRDITLPAPAKNFSAKFSSYTIMFTNGDTAVHTVTLTGVAGQFGVVPAVHYCTNSHVTQIVVQFYEPYTNSYKLDF